MGWFSGKSSTPRGPSASVLMSGYITRLSKKEWKRRYYILRTDRTLVYYKSNLHLSSPKVCSRQSSFIDSQPYFRSTTIQGTIKLSEGATIETGQV
jgi:hypothetical protein